MQRCIIGINTMGELPPAPMEATLTRKPEAPRDGVELPRITLSERLVPEGYRIDKQVVERAVMRCAHQDYLNYPKTTERLHWSQGQIDAWQQQGMPLDWMIPENAPVYVNNDPNRLKQSAQGQTDYYDYTAKSFKDSQGKILPTEPTLHPQWKEMLLDGVGIPGLGFNWTVNKERNGVSEVASARDGAILFVDNEGILSALTVTRSDTGQQAFVGGFGKDMAALLAEFDEETHFDPQDLTKIENVYDGPAADPRDTLFCSRRTNLTVYLPTDIQRDLILQGIAKKDIYGDDDAKSAQIMRLSEENIDAMFAMHPELARAAIDAWQTETGLVVDKQGRVGKASLDNLTNYGMSDNIVSMSNPESHAVLTEKRTYPTRQELASKLQHDSSVAYPLSPREAGRMMARTTAHISAVLAAQELYPPTGVSTRDMFVRGERFLARMRMEQVFHKATERATQAFFAGELYGKDGEPRRTITVGPDGQTHIEYESKEVEKAYKDAYNAPGEINLDLLPELVQAAGIQGFDREKIETLLQRAAKNFKDIKQVTAKLLGVSEDILGKANSMTIGQTTELLRVQVPPSHEYARGLIDKLSEENLPPLSPDEVTVLSLADRLANATWQAGQILRAQVEGSMKRITVDNPEMVDSDGKKVDIEKQPGRGVYLPYDLVLNYNFNQWSTRYNPVQAFIGTAFVESWKDIWQYKGALEKRHA